MDIHEQEPLGQRYPGEADPGQLAHPAVGPVAAHQPADPALATAGEADRDPLGILVGRGHFAAPEDLAAQLGDPPPKLGFNLGLGDHQPGPGDQGGGLADAHPGRRPAVDVDHDLLNLERPLGQAAQGTEALHHLDPSRLQAQRPRRPTRPSRLVDNLGRHAVGEQPTGERQPGRARTRDQHLRFGPQQDTPSTRS